MRVIVYGVGAVGGTLAVALTRSGVEVVGIARGKQFDAIRADGLVLRTPDGDLHARFACVADPAEIDFRADDLILLTMKTQDTVAALDRLRAAGVQHQAIFCVQNGLANDDMALRLFPNVYGVVLEMPVNFLKPGEVVDFFSPILGLFYIGRHGAGEDMAGEALASLLNAAGFAAFLQADIAPLRHAKLLMNLANAISAVIADSAAAAPYVEAARAEARAVHARAGIVPADLVAAAGGLKPAMRDVPGAERAGSSSAQSLVRGAGSIETDYLNGEIVLLGRKLGVPTPVNAWFAQEAQRLMREGKAPGSVSLAEVRMALPQIG